MTLIQSPIQRVISRLQELQCDPRKAGSEWEARCPAHDDRKPSLGVNEGDDGRVLINCRAGCSFEAVLAALGLEKADLFVPSGKRSSSRSSKALRSKASANGNGRGYKTALEAIAWTASKKGLGKPSKEWLYRDAAGGELMQVFRFDLPTGGKSFLPAWRDSVGLWHCGDPPGKLPIYHLDEVGASELVFVTEGEKCADLVRGCGLVGTTAAHGADAAEKSDWSVLAGKRVGILPDNDEPGAKYAKSVCGLLGGLMLRPCVRVLDLGLTNKGDDVEQWLERVPDSWGPDECRVELTRLFESAADWKPAAASDSQGRADNRPILNRHGLWVSCLHNSILWLEESGRSIKHDRFREALLVDGEPLTDEILVGVTAAIERDKRVRWNQEHVGAALIEIGSRNHFSSLTQWLDSLVWDGVKRLDTFFQNAYGCEGGDYSAACARVLFLSAVARAYRPGCQADVMIVLIGDQGVFKSTGLSALCHDPDWFTDDLGSDLHDRKSGEGLRAKWIVEFGEFSRINRSTLDVVKGFITRKVDHYRPPYGKVARDFPRTCVFVGSTNDPHPLHDTENRRFMPITCTMGNIDWVKANRDQLWAESVHYFRAGAKWWVTDPEMVVTTREKQEAAKQADYWETVLSRELGSQSTITMKQAIEALEIPPDRMDRSTQTRIGLALRWLGYTRKQVRDGEERRYEWYKAVP
jgi:hypothetical protein